MISNEKKKQIENYFQNYLANYKNYKKTRVWCYEDGVVMLGAYDLYLATQKEEYRDFDVKFLDECIAKDGQLIGYDKENCSTDDLMAGYPLFLINKSNPHTKYSLALAKLREQYKIHPRTEDGSFFHKKRYPHQVWLDGLYMAQPLYCLFGIEEKSSAVLNDVVNQFLNVEKNLYDKKQERYLHAYDESRLMPWADKKSGRSQNVWLRSVGWYAMAAVDVIDILMANHSLELVNKLKNIPSKVIDSLNSAIDIKSYMYRDLPFVDDKRNYLETSGSVMIAYACLKGWRIGLLPSKYLKRGQKILEGVINNCFYDDKLNNICSVSGLDDKGRDGTIDYYLSEKVVSNDAKGVGPFMMAYAEYLNSAK